MADFYLASHSARRRELLRQVGARFETLLLRSAAPRIADVDERTRPDEAPEDYVLRVAREKAEAGVRVLAGRSLLARPVLGADTTVVVDGLLLGKPHDAAQAADFLARLAGRSHEVRTAVVLAIPAGRKHTVASAVSTTRVTLRALGAEEIARYAASGEPLDKAGGYALQGRAAIFVERIEGSYSGVVGLPLAETATLLAGAGIRLI
jgi:septum formation protein